MCGLFEHGLGITGPSLVAESINRLMVFDGLMVMRHASVDCDVGWSCGLGFEESRDEMARCLAVEPFDQKIHVSVVLPVDL